MSINFTQSIPNSQIYTDIDQPIMGLESIMKRYKEGVLSLVSIDDEINYILIGLKNSKREGYFLTKTQEIINELPTA